MRGRRKAPTPVMRDMLRRELETFSRAPFQGALVDLLEGKPSLEDIKIWAQASPDRWAQALTILARLSGYHEKREVIQSFHILIAEMSDAQLLSELEKSEKEGLVIEHGPLPDDT